MHVAPEPVARPVHVEAAVGFLRDRLVDRTLEEPESNESLDQHAERRGVDRLERHAWADGGDAGRLRGEHGLVQVALRSGVALPGRPGAGHVGAVAGLLGSGVDQDELLGAERSIVARVV